MAFNFPELAPVAAASSLPKPRLLLEVNNEKRIFPDRRQKTTAYLGFACFLSRENKLIQVTQSFSVDDLESISFLKSNGV